MHVSPNLEVIKCQGTCREYHVLLGSYMGKDMCATNISLFQHIFPVITITDFSLTDWNQSICEYLSTVFWAVKCIWYLTKVRTSATFFPHVSHTAHQICVKGTGSCCHGAHTGIQVEHTELLRTVIWRGERVWGLVKSAGCLLAVAGLQPKENGGWEVFSGKERGGGGVRKAREGKEGIWIPAKTRSSAKHTVQECQHTPTPTWSSTKKEWRVKETR